MTAPWVVSQIVPPEEMETPLGRGLAKWRTDYGPEHHIIYEVHLYEGGRIVEFKNTELRIGPNWTMGRRQSDEIRRDNRMAEATGGSVEPRAAEAPARAKPSQRMRAPGA